MFQHYINTVDEFHTAFKVKPKSLSSNLKLRESLLWEEYMELGETKSPTDELDALTDMLYIASGTLAQYDQLILFNNAPTEHRDLKKIMHDIDSTPSYHAWLNFHVELIHAIHDVADAKNYDLRGAFDEVHSSNMSKLDDYGKPVLRDDGKILKGPNYRPPRLEKFTVKVDKEPAIKKPVDGTQ